MRYVLIIISVEISSTKCYLGRKENVELSVVVPNNEKNNLSTAISSVASREVNEHNSNAIHLPVLRKIAEEGEKRRQWSFITRQESILGYYNKFMLPNSPTKMVWP